MLPLYFGCWGRSGHNFYDPAGKHVYNHSLMKLNGKSIDTGYCPPCWNHNGHYSCSEACQPQGWARVTSMIWAGDALTVLAFWDRTGDGRGGSHSTFLLPGRLDLSRAEAAARSAFPSIWQRLDAAGVKVYE